MFTSKLPTSTSARRPTHHDAGSTSFGLNRPSAIPVTVKKANLFTPQTKRPFLSGATTAGKSFMSNTAGKPYRISNAMTTDKKYQRPLKPVPDRDEQLRMFDGLVDFLKSYAPHLPLPEAKKFFSSISTTESARIFECLIGQFLQDFKVNRLEIDVPEALALLKYPYVRSVTKSALVSVTTRQAVVGLLVIFDWLVEKIRFVNITPEDDEGELDEVWEMNKIIFLHPENVREALLQKLETMHPSEDCQTILNQIEEINAEIDHLSAEYEEIERMESKINDYKEDIAKCNEYNLQMEKYIQTKLEEESKLEKQILEWETRFEERKKEKDLLSIAVKNHDLDVDEVKRDQALIEGLESRLSHLLESVNENYRKEILPQLEESIKKFDREFETVKLEFMSLRSKQEALLEEEDKLTQQLVEKSDKENKALANELDLEKQRLKKAKENFALNIELNEKYLKSVLDRARQQATNLVKDIQRDAKYWEDERKNTEEDLRVARHAQKLFRRLKPRLNK